MEMVQAFPGGVGGVVQAFERAGIGGVAQTWIGQGPNQAVTPGQVQQALGPGPVGQVASRIGGGPDEAAGHIARLLPQLIDHLSPQGTAPADGGLGAIGGLLSQLKL